MKLRIVLSIIMGTLLIACKPKPVTEYKPKFIQTCVDGVMYLRDVNRYPSYVTEYHDESGNTVSCG